jgi:putative spermidine/putrescine transport system ATP-binding protein
MGSQDPGAGGAEIRFVAVTKRFGDITAVDDQSFVIDAGAFFSLLGPSGSGKTTCLRMIAGFEQPTEGRIEIDGVDVTGLPPFERDVNTVFQDYALFPHMKVADNVGYGLMVRKVPRSQRVARVADALAMVRLEGYENRRPAQLSGGQRQRVALARALVNRPRVLLLDEPLGALDLKLRQAMQIELKAIHREVGITFVFVTHDQEEALAMSDRVAVFNEGRVEQVGTSLEVYEHPSTAFVAGFVGTTNLLRGDIAQRLLGSPEPVSLRPERIRLVDAGRAPASGEVVADGRVRDVVYLGMHSRYLVELDAGSDLTVVIPNADLGRPITRGEPVRALWPHDAVQSVAGLEPTTNGREPVNEGEEA